MRSRRPGVTRTHEVWVKLPRARTLAALTIGAVTGVMAVGVAVGVIVSTPAATPATACGTGVFACSTPAPVSAPVSAPVPAPAIRGPVKLATLTPCVEEDSTDCYWNAGTAGNGVGHSFYAVTVGNETCVIYWSPAANRRFGQCYPLAYGTAGE